MLDLEGADQSYSTCIYANEMQALFSAFASNKRTHRQWKCIGIGIGVGPVQFGDKLTATNCRRFRRLQSPVGTGL